MVIKKKKPSSKTTSKSSKNNNETVNVLTFGQKAADWVTWAVGSWTFIIGLFVFMFIWMGLNTFMVIKGIWDPYPFILLNFVLSCLAAVQAPIILMSQNRAAEKDRKRFEYDYSVNRKAEREITQIQKTLNSINRKLK